MGGWVGQVWCGEGFFEDVQLKHVLTQWVLDGHQEDCVSENEYACHDMVYRCALRIDVSIEVAEHHGCT